MSKSSQVFQAKSPLRWQSVKWTTRIFLILTTFLFIVLAFTLYSGSVPSLPNLKAQSRDYQNTLDPARPLTLSNALNKKYKGFKEFLFSKQKEDALKKSTAGTGNKASAVPFIRAAFYTPWSANTSLPDLEKYGDKLNTIFPEWFFIDTLTLRLQTRIDSAGLSIMRLKNLDIIPLLSNFNSSIRDFDAKLLHKLMVDTVKRNQLVSQLRDTLRYYHFKGINIDFEELAEKSNASLTAFQKKLFETLHPEGYTVTMDVEPMNNDYDYKKLADYNDYIILMAYDQSNNATGPGPISSQQWIEEALDWTASKMDAKKIILGVGGFGYDWANGKYDSAYTYNDVINKARALDAKIIYDNNNFNLHYSYSERIENGDGKPSNVEHEVWFTDAATTFNITRFSDEYSTAGTALWRLGSEDARMWSYYNRDLGNTAISINPFNFDVLKAIPIIPDNVGFEGEGELLDIIYSPQPGKINLEIDTAEQLIAEQDYVQLPSGYVIRKLGEDTTTGPGHKLILTFDDGPSTEFTPQILDILEAKKVPATFFVVGLSAEANIPLLQRINRDGYEIGNHTFTHHNIAKMSAGRAAVEMKLTRLLIESVTGRSTILFRAPYNADSEPRTYEELEPIARSRNENYLTVGESIDPMDWQVNVKADSIVSRVIKQVEDRNASIILLHDAGGESRQQTVDALPGIIDYFKNKGYVFTTVADLVGKKRNDVMPPIPASRDGWTKNLNLFLAEGTYWGSHFIFSLFIVGIFLSIARIIAMAMLASFQMRRDKKDNAAPVYAAAQADTTYPLVSIIIPAYNEEINSVRTVQSILNQDYPEVEIIFVDDGSTDQTFEKANTAFRHMPMVKIFTKPNGGKASALNFGIDNAQAGIVICIDADTQLKADAISRLVRKFDNETVAAVAGNVKVGNEVNMITRWQSIEYITSQNFDRRAFHLLNCITVVPGAIGAFKKEAIKNVGGFTTDTLAEDCDLTMRLLRYGYTVRNCTEAIAYTEAPETVKQFMNQRFRWSFGVMQCFWKHRDTVFNPAYKNFGMIAMPNLLIYQMVLPFLAPLADFVLVVSLIAAAAGIVVASIPHIILYYIIFNLIDIAGAALAFTFEKEDYRKLFWMLPQRLVYRQMMYYVLFKSFNKAIKGELQGWGVLKRTGSVKDIAIQ